MSRLKLLIKSNRILYRIWFALNRHRINNGNIRLPKKTDDFYFDGYPRSGNTYTYHLIKHIFPNLISCSHLHTIAAVKLAFKNDLNTFIIIRNPQDAVLSFLYTKINRNAGPLKSDRTTLLNELLQEWIEYYSFVYRHINKLTIIQFSEVIESPANISKKVACALNRDKTYLDKIDAKINEYSELMKRGENAKEKAYSSLPNEDRALFKDYNKQLYYECELKNEAISLYKNITS